MAEDKKTPEERIALGECVSFDEAKNQVAKKYYCSDWGHLMAKIRTDGNFRFMHGANIESSFDEAALLYGDSQYNQGIDAVEKIVMTKAWFYSTGLQSEFIEELKKLKR